MQVSYWFPCVILGVFPVPANSVQVLSLLCVLVSTTLIDLLLADSVNEIVVRVISFGFFFAFCFLLCLDTGVEQLPLFFSALVVTVLFLFIVTGDNVIHIGFLAV